MNKQLIIPSPEAMMQFGATMGSALSAKVFIIFLSGDLGAGKTTFVKGFLRGMGFNGNVKSPTYTLVESYEVNQQMVHHFDFYRLNSPAEIEFLGIQDYFEKNYSLIEWPEKAMEELPSADLHIHFAIHEDVRMITFEAKSPKAVDLLEKLHEK